MSAVAFDTYKAVKSLKEAGFTEEQASAITNSVKDMGREAELVTKRDLEQSIESVRTELKDVRTELKQDIESVRVDIVNLDHKFDTRMIRLESELLLLKWMISFVLAGITALILKSLF